MDKNDAPFFELPNGVNARPIAPMFYGKDKDPMVCNYKAEKVEPAKIMRHVLEAK